MTALVWTVALAVAGCGGDGVGSSPSRTDVTTTAVVDTSSPTSPGVEDLDFVYQAAVDDPGYDGDDGIGVFVSIGGEIRRVDEAAPGGRHKHPTWTRDGSQVVFIAEGEWDDEGTVVRGTAVWVVDPTGEHARSLITCDDCWDLDNPAWSPSGTQVAYVEYDAPADPTSQMPPAASRIVVVDLATGERSVVVGSEPGQLVDLPRWSPDGRSLVVSIDRFDDRGSETGSSFGIVPASGADTVPPMLPFDEYAYSADWNWATGALVFSVEGQGYAWTDPKVSHWDLFEIQPDGSGRRTITDIGDTERLYLPMWSSDGSLIAASLDTTPNELGGSLVVVVDAATGVITPLGPEGGRTRLRPD